MKERLRILEEREKRDELQATKISKLKSMISNMENDFKDFKHIKIDIDISNAIDIKTVNFPKEDDEYYKDPSIKMNTEPEN